MSHFSRTEIKRISMKCFTDVERIKYKRQSRALRVPVNRGLKHTLYRDTVAYSVHGRAKRRTLSHPGCISLERVNEDRFIDD